MRLLFLLLWRNNFTILFILLQGLSVYLLVENSYFQRASFLNATNDVVAGTMEGVSYIKEYINLREVNKTLSEENARLRSKLNESLYDTSNVNNPVKDSVYNQQYIYVVARVINNSINRRNNYLTLDKGSLQGIQPEMGVISPDGIVGIVKQVSPHFCTVMSVLHKDTRVSAMIKRNHFFGSLTWNGDDPSFASLNEIDKTVPVSKGDTIITTSFSSVYPSGVMIGTVHSVEQHKGSNFHTIEIRLSSRFDNLTRVYIVKNLLKKEQQQTEAESTSETK